MPPLPLHSRRGAGLSPAQPHLLPCGPARATSFVFPRHRESSRRHWSPFQATTDDDHPAAARRLSIRLNAVPPQASSTLWSSHVSRRMNLSLAVEDAIDCALEACPKSESGAGASSVAPSLALVFVSSAFAEEYERVVSLIRSRLPSVTKIFGCSGFGVIGGCSSASEEIENVPAISITLASLPGADIHLSHVAMHNLPTADAPPTAWNSLLGLPPTDSGSATKPLSLVVLADISFLRLQELLAGLDYALPGANVIGGLSSAGMMTPHRALFCFDAAHVNADPATQHGIYQTGAVVMALHGGVSMELLVAQGCRPLSGTTWSVEAVDHGRNMVTAVSEEGTSGRSATLAAAAAAGTARRLLSPLKALQRDLVGLADDASQLKALLQNMMVGLAPDPLRDVVEPQDFLVRPMGFSKQDGSMELGDYVRVGQRLKFVVRDVKGAMEDLQSHGTAFKKRQLEELLSGAARPPPLGMMIFTCSGRGTSLYSQPSYDTRTVSAFVPVPAAGFLCNGEIGSVNGTSHLHGFTCVVGVLRSAEGPTPPESSPLAEGATSEGVTPESSDGEGASISRRISGSPGTEP